MKERVIIIVLASTIAVGALWTFLGMQESQISQPTNLSDSAISSISRVSSPVIEQPLRSHEPATVAVPKLQVRAAVVLPPAVDGKAEFELYLALAECYGARNIQGNISTSHGMLEREQRCKNVSAEQVLDRFKHLAQAARDGVPGAARAFEAAGPFGDPSALKTRPDDPLVLEWKAQALKYYDIALAHGELSVLNEIALNHASGLITPQDFDKALVYGLAARELGEANPIGNAMIEGMPMMIGPERSAAAFAAAQALAQSLRPK